MHEVEVQQGFVSRKNDARGIERIRQLAYKLQGIPIDDDVSNTDLSTINNRNGMLGIRMLALPPL